METGKKQQYGCVQQNTKQQKLDGAFTHPAPLMSSTVCQPQYHRNHNGEDPDSIGGSAQPQTINPGNYAGNRCDQSPTEQAGHAENGRACIENNPGLKLHRCHHANDTDTAKQASGQQLL